MLIGRESELRTLEELYGRNEFTALALYGRPHVGKSVLLKEFLRSHAPMALYLGACALSDALNLERCSQAVLRHFKGDFSVPFKGWEEFFSYLAQQGKDERLIIAIDDYQLLASRHLGFSSMLAQLIGRELRQSRIMLILCGSDEGIMQQELTGVKAPLRGSLGAVLELKGFDCFDSTAFFPHYDVEEKLCAYAILGGNPGYMTEFDPMLSLKDNLSRYVLRECGSLRWEPQQLLRRNLREISTYNGILQAIAAGRHSLQEISSAVHESGKICSKYLDTLISLGIANKEVPCGEKENSRRGRYVIADHYLRFWYTFIFAKKAEFELMDEEHAAQEILGSLAFSHFMEQSFAGICREFLRRKARRGELPFTPACMGRWWGGRGSETVEILLSDKSRERVIIGGCKYSYEPFGRQDLETLLRQGACFPKSRELYFCIFSRSGFSEYVREQSKQQAGLLLYDLFDLFTPDWTRRGI